ncbi:hypothetical protein Q5752_001220 [Cryptotrichosporon argae]
MSGRDSWSSNSGAYRPLNVRDALTYLDQVKIQFVDQPDVYNRFLDVMKEFKGQVIDTPGVIERVSSLFRGHPVLIQGFNTFLPPGYRIDCTTDGENGTNVITVTTPNGTVTTVPGPPGALAAAINASAVAVAKAVPEPVKETKPAPSAIPLPAAPAQPAPASGPSTPSAAQFLANNLNTKAGQPVNARAAPMLEFNHAISFVNKIKNRFEGQPETYKNFLEILQTYQRDSKGIEEVYEQVTELFKHAPDLIDEFKQFLPEAGGGVGLSSFIQAAGAPVPDKTNKRGNKEKDAAAPKKRRLPDPKRNKKADSPEEEATAITTAAPQTIALPEDVAFFDKVKKFIDDKVTYHEFLKLVNLFSQDMIDARVLLERAAIFIGDSGEIWQTFKRIVGADDAGVFSQYPLITREGYGFGGMINADSQVVENTPMLERVKPDLSGPKVKSYGPSYRRLPKSEINLHCTGRDAMCWEVLNDEWVSHPTWAAEDAAPFLAHRKNAYEEALHKSEEERHEYDFHIEANLRTIAMLEPVNLKIQAMDDDERATYNMKSALNGPSRSICQRIIKKVYGKELGLEILRAMQENPYVALPIVLARLKQKDEEWKRAQRDWNRIWREQDAKNFYKALDHQGVVFKTTDKKTIAAKSLIAEIEARRRDQTNARKALMHPRTPVRQRHQFEFEFKDVDVIKDMLKLVIGYLDRANALAASDKEKIEHHLRDFVPAFFLFDKDEFDADFGDVDHQGTESDSAPDSDGDVSMADDDGKKKTPNASNSDSLRKKLLKAAKDRKRDDTGTPVPAGEHDDVSAEGTPATELGERAETPLPPPADPETVAEAVEKDKVTADASEQTWVQIDTPADPAAAAATASTASSPVDKPKPARKANFFANNHYYVLIRLVQILYSRLVICKQIAQRAASERKQPINPEAVRLGLADPATQNFGVEDGENPARYYYEHLLALTERLFDSDIDAATFEETLRLMFGTKAYIMFTVDRVIAAVVKQAQTVIGDLKSQELWSLLVRDRQTDTTTTRSQIAYRMNAEAVLGPDENLYRIEYLPRTEVVAVQLMARDDLTIDDAETAEQRWRQYIDSYVLTHPTEGLPHRVEQPFLNRNLADIPETVGSDAFTTSSGLQFRIAMGSYRAFFTPDTEDYYHRQTDPAPAEDGKALADAKERRDKWVDKRLEEIKAAPAPVSAHSNLHAARSPPRRS